MADYLSRLPQHAVFSRSATAVSPADPTTLVAVRASELLVLAGQELRLASLVDVKQGRQAGYRVLACPHLKPASLGQITSLVLSPSGKLLILRGPHTLIALVLPRPGTALPSASSLAASSSSSSAAAASAAAAPGSLPCPSVLLGPFVHSSTAKPPITDAQFHPSGRESLIVLDAEGGLNEYDLEALASAPVAGGSRASGAGSLARSTTTAGAFAGSSSSSRASVVKDTSPDPSEPVQTLALLPSRPRSGRFGAFDPSSLTAVSLAFPSSSSASAAVDGGEEGGGEAADWGRLTVYVGMENGDVRCLCPFVPTKPDIPPSYLLALHTFTRSKLDLARSAIPIPPVVAASTPSAYSLEAGPHPSSSSNSAALATSSSVLLPALSAPAAAVAKKNVERYTSQLAFVSSLLARAGLSSFDAEDDADELEEAERDTRGDESVFGGRLLEGPRTTGKGADFGSAATSSATRRLALPGGGWKAAVQGPLLMRPAPLSPDDDDEEDETLVGLAMLSSSSSAFSPSLGDGEGDATADELAAGAGNVNALVTLSSAGRLAVFLELDKPEAVFLFSSATRKNVNNNGSSRGVGGNGGGRFGSSSTGGPQFGEGQSRLLPAAVEDGEGEGGPAYAAPTLTLYETALVPLLATSSSPDDDAGEGKRSVGRLGMHKDPLYADTLYLSGPTGLYIVRLSWLSTLARALALPTDVDRQAALDRFAVRGRGATIECLVETEGERAVESAAVVQDVYLGYGLVVGLERAGAVGLALDLRVANELEDEPSSSSTELLPTESADEGGYHSLLAREPINLPSILDPSSAGPTPRSATASEPLATITPAVLRSLGSHAASARERAHELAQAGRAVQGRVDLQLKELSRQLAAVSPSSSGGALRGTAAPLDPLERRLEEVRAAQIALVRRADAVLQRAMDGSSPVVSERERAWFAELGELEQALAASGGLRDRFDTIEQQLAILQPKLAAAAATTPSTPAKTAVLGKLQLARLEDSLSAEARLLGTATRKLDDLTARLGAVCL